jgi:hypothetical protein
MSANAAPHVIICLMSLFDTPLRSDPLWWFGLVGGTIGGVWAILAKDLTGADAVLAFIANVVGFTFWIAYLVGGSIRAVVRRRRRRPGDGSTVPGREQLT